MSNMSCFICVDRGMLDDHFRANPYIVVSIIGSRLYDALDNRFTYLGTIEAEIDVSWLRHSDFSN